MTWSSFLVVLTTTARVATEPELLTPLSAGRVWKHLVAEQPVVPRSRAFTQLRRELSSIPGYELRRGKHPDAGAEAIASILRMPRRVGSRGKR